jgi:hypothetical protein
MRTQAECEYLIRRKGLASEDSLCVRPLTKAEIDRMPEPVYEWHLRANKENLEKALNEPVLKKQAEASALAEKASRHKDRKATPEDLKAAEADCLKFANDYPQLIQDSEQNQAIMRWIFDHNLPIDYRNLVRAFEALTQSGALLLNPSACEAGSETEITGHLLSTHRNLHKLLAPYNAESRAKREFDKMSAKDYKAASIRENPEDWPESVPPALIQQRIDKVTTDFFGLHPEHKPSEQILKAVREFFDGMNWGIKDWNLTNLNFAFEELIKAGAIKPATNPEGLRAVGQVHRVTDLRVGREHRPGWPERSTKSSFNKKTDNLTAEEFKNEISTDPAYRAALDLLGSR